MIIIRYIYIHLLIYTTLDILICRTIIILHAYCELYMYTKLRPTPEIVKGHNSDA